MSENKEPLTDSELRALARRIVTEATRLGLTVREYMRALEQIRHG